MNDPNDPRFQRRSPVEHSVHPDERFVPTPESYQPQPTDAAPDVPANTEGGATTGEGAQ